jgi:glycerol-3-phosphate O-acyltransferase/dihydroxyacetone phosphate acyltransferase
MTAKSTLFGRKTFSSWLIENVGSVPIKRAKDYDGQKVDNSQVMGTLLDALDKQGDMVCFFPGTSVTRHDSSLS